MHDQNAAKLLAYVMSWQDYADVSATLDPLQLLADYKYDRYQQFGPGRRFIESLALWIKQFDPQDRQSALDFVLHRLVYFSDEEMSHLVRTAYPDLIIQERLRMVAEEHDIAPHRVGEISRHPRFTELRLKSLYLGKRRCPHQRTSAYQFWGHRQRTDLAGLRAWRGKGRRHDQ